MSKYHDGERRGLSKKYMYILCRVYLDMSSLINPCDSRCLRMQDVSSLGHGVCAVSNDGNTKVITSNIFILPCLSPEKGIYLFVFDSTLWTHQSSIMWFMSHRKMQNTEPLTDCYSHRSSLHFWLFPTFRFHYRGTDSCRDFPNISTRSVNHRLKVTEDMMFPEKIFLPCYLNPLWPGRLMINEQTPLLKTTDLVPVGCTAAAAACNAICPETSQHDHQRMGKNKSLKISMLTEFMCSKPKLILIMRWWRSQLF